MNTTCPVASNATMLARPFLAALLLAAPLGAQTLVHTTWGAASGEGLALTVAVGDLNHDGHPDLALGSPDDASGRGRVTVVSGTDWSTLFSVTGSVAGERFGAAIAPAGDVNGDGRADLIVGAPGTGSMNGSARVLSGLDGSTLLTLTGPSAGSRFGAAVAGAGDVNGDGRADLLVGAPQDGAGSGRVTEFSGASGSTLQSLAGSAGDSVGSSLGGWSMVDDEPIEIIGCTDEGNSGAGHVLICAGNLATAATLVGPSSGARFGAAVARLGDVNGDGHGDIAVGAPGASGSVTVYSGASWSPLFTLTAPAANTGFGSAVAAAGDVNADGHGDIACGAPLADVNGTDSGTISVYSGAAGGLLYSVVGGAAGDRLGTSAATAGDQNGNGEAEFVAAAPGADHGLLADTGEASIVELVLWNTVENGLPGVSGVPRLTGDGGLTSTTAASLSLTSARPITGASLVVGLALILDAAHGVLVPTPDVVVTGLQTSGSGSLDYDFALTGLASGTAVYEQFLIFDSSAPGGIARSNTVAAIVP